MALALQTWLREGGTPADLGVSQYRISSKRHGLYPNLLQFKYHQFESPFGHQIVCEARGIILDEAENWAVVSFPYTKFFNHGEPYAADIDWSTARAYEKLDGSLCTMYFYDGAWRVATSGTPDANTPVNDNAQTFSDLFWETFKSYGWYHRDAFDPSCCYMFELMTASNQVVVRHPQPRLVLHGFRSLLDLQEGAAELWTGSAEVVKSYPLDTLDAVVAAATDLNPMEQEGFVVRDRAFNRVKVKSPAYVAIHHVKDGICPRRIRNMVRTGEHGEFIQYFPDLQREVALAQGRHEVLVKRIETVWESLRGIEDRKEFAIQATKYRFSGVLFCLFSGKTQSTRAYLANVAESYYEQLMREEQSK